MPVALVIPSVIQAPIEVASASLCCVSLVTLAIRLWAAFALSGAGQAAESVCSGWRMLAGEHAPCCVGAGPAAALAVLGMLVEHAAMWWGCTLILSFYQVRVHPVTNSQQRLQRSQPPPSLRLPAAHALPASSIAR